MLPTDLRMVNTLGRAARAATAIETRLGGAVTFTMRESSIAVRSLEFSNVRAQLRQHLG
jgi:hypothetical protein